jgi:hypothetical protein
VTQAAAVSVSAASSSGFTSPIQGHHIQVSNLHSDVTLDDLLVCMLQPFWYGKSTLQMHCSKLFFTFFYLLIFKNVFVLGICCIRY